MWSIKYVSSTEPDTIGVFTDKNHLSSIWEYIYNISDIFYEVGLVKQIGAEKGEIQHNISKWKEENLSTKDLCVILLDGKMKYWLPVVELTKMSEFIEKYGEPNFGYVDGRWSHMGAFSSQGMMSSNMNIGYVIWLESKNKK